MQLTVFSRVFGSVSHLLYISPPIPENIPDLGQMKFTNEKHSGGWRGGFLTNVGVDGDCVIEL